MAGQPRVSNRNGCEAWEVSRQEHRWQALRLQTAKVQAPESHLALRMRRPDRTAGRNSAAQVGAIPGAGMYFPHEDLENPQLLQSPEVWRKRDAALGSVGSEPHPVEEAPSIATRDQLTEWGGLEYVTRAGRDVVDGWRSRSEADLHTSQFRLCRPTEGTAPIGWLSD